MSGQQPTASEAMAMVAMNAVFAVEKKLDSELRALDDVGEDELAAIRKKRLQDLKSKQAKAQEWKRLGHGVYSEVSDQKAWFEAAKQSKRMICHFYRNSNRHCKILDQHLEKLAAGHLETRFIKIDAEKAVYLSQHLNIVLLPTILMTKDNITEDRVEGFDELGGTDTFSTEELARRLAKKNMIDLLPAEKEDAAGKPKKGYNASNPDNRAIYMSQRKAMIDAMDSDEEDLLS
eukprot:g15073.t1